MTIYGGRNPFRAGNCSPEDIQHNMRMLNQLHNDLGNPVPGGPRRKKPALDGDGNPLLDPDGEPEEEEEDLSPAGWIRFELDNDGSTLDGTSAAYVLDSAGSRAKDDEDDLIKTTVLDPLGNYLGAADSSKGYAKYIGDQYEVMSLTTPAGAAPTLADDGTSIMRSGGTGKFLQEWLNTTNFPANFNTESGSQTVGRGKTVEVLGGYSIGGIVGEQYHHRNMVQAKQNVTKVKVPSEGSPDTVYLYTGVNDFDINLESQDYTDTTGLSGSVTGTTGAGVPVTITSAAHGLTSGQQVQVSGVVGNTAANGVWVCTVTDEDNFSLNGSSGDGDYGSGGVWGTGLWSSTSDVPGEAWQNPVFHRYNSDYAPTLDLSATDYADARQWVQAPSFGGIADSPELPEGKQLSTVYQDFQSLDGKAYIVSDAPVTASTTTQTFDGDTHVEVLYDGNKYYVNQNSPVFTSLDEKVAVSSGTPPGYLADKLTQVDDGNLFTNVVQWEVVGNAVRGTTLRNNLIVQGKTKKVGEAVGTAAAGNNPGEVWVQQIDPAGADVQAKLWAYKTPEEGHPVLIARDHKEEWWVVWYGCDKEPA